MMVRFLVLMLLSLVITGCENELKLSDIPSVVENTFKSNFPYAKDVEWETYGENFEVDFELKKTDYAARIDNAGNLLEYKYEIEKNTLPPAIISKMKTNFSNSGWDDTEILVSGKNRYYQLEIDGFLNDKKIILDSKGNIMNDFKSWD